MALRKRKFVPKEVVITAVQYNQTNGKEIAEWINKLEIEGSTVRNRGFYMTIEHLSFSVPVRKGDWVFYTQDQGWVTAMSDAEFKERFVAKKPAITPAQAQADIEGRPRRRKGSEPKPAEQHVGL